MQERFFKIWSVVTNPLWIPFVVSFWFLSYNTYDNDQQVNVKLYLIGLLTIIIPLLIYVILKILGIVQSIDLKTSKERTWPLICYTILIVIVARGGFRDGFHTPLYYFFIGIVVASFIAAVLSFMRYKISLHMMGIGGLLGFVFVLLFTMNLPLLYLIAGISIIAGVTASARLYLKAHSNHEIIFGFLTGLITQIYIGV
ncbi:hypothetical protein [Nonlabens sp. MIC269]|uniref:hypothetical protein n=1 Tax=Nonlabens sp. MIC269 TaxID=1476901 RepID=UPI000AD50448|nr:hypothetical protein [Nonlabens sp. MIC269]